MSNSRNQNGRSLPPFGNFISYIHSRKHEVYAPATSLGPGYNSPKVMPEFEGFISYLHTRKHEVAAPKSEKHEVAVPKSEKHEVAAPKPEKHEVAAPKPTYCVHSSSYDHLSPDIPVGYEEGFSGEIQEGKKRRRIEKKGVSEGRKSEERGRKIFKEEKGVFRSQHERPLTMELGGLTSWGNADKTIFNAEIGQPLTMELGGLTSWGNADKTIFNAEIGQVVSMFWAMLMKELISDDDMSALLHRADKWFKDRGAWWTFVLDTNVPLERKANILKLDLRST